MTRHPLQRLGDIVLLSLLLIAGWEALSLLIGTRVLPSPPQTAHRIIVAFGQPSFLRDIAATGQAYVVALAMAMAGGVVFGLMFGVSRFIGETFEPAMHVLVAVPKVTLYPVILLLFGLGDAAKIAFGVLHGLPTVAIMTASAIRSLKPIYRKTALTMRLSPRRYALRHPVAGGGAGDLRQPAHLLCLHAARRAHRRDVCLDARARPFADEFDRRRRHADGDGDRRADVPVRRLRQRRAARGHRPLPEVTS